LRETRKKKSVWLKWIGQAQLLKKLGFLEKNIPYTVFFFFLFVFLFAQWKQSTDKVE
jgi:hypothetical protein